jgi:tetratricopeptide (TPR) repeat protein
MDSNSHQNDHVLQEVTPEMIHEEITAEIRADPDLFLRVIEQKLLFAVEKKEEGNRKYGNRDYQGAILAYKEGLLAIKFENFKDVESPLTRDKIIDVFSKMLNNIAQCFIALERWEEALDVCDKVRKLDPNDLKSYYRAGLCLKNLGKLRDSFAILEEGSKMARSVNATMTPDYVSLKNDIAKQINEDRQKQKEMFGGMFQKGQKTKTEDTPAKNSSGLFFPVVTGFGGVCSYLALNAFPGTKAIRDEEKIAISCSVGAGLGGIASTNKPALKALSVGAIAGGLGWLAYRFYESQK